MSRTNKKFVDVQVVFSSFSGTTLSWRLTSCLSSPHTCSTNSMLILNSLGLSSKIKENETVKPNHHTCWEDGGIRVQESHLIS